MTTSETHMASSSTPMALSAAQLSEFDQRGFIIIESLLEQAQLQTVRDALAPYFKEDIRGRNNFEGQHTNRIYSLIAKHPIFAELSVHPIVMQLAERELGRDFLLASCLAINLKPGESEQPWHFDDAHITAPRPRPAYGLSSFWLIDETTEENGATEFLLGSHKWGDTEFDGQLSNTDFDKRQHKPESRHTLHKELVKATAPAGSLVLAKGTIWHRGGANRSNQPRLILTPQYCPGWARQLENFMLGVSPDIAKTLPEKARELIGYSIYQPFMGYVDGRHPKRLLE